MRKKSYVIAHFKTTGSILVEPGWKAVYGTEFSSEAQDKTVPLSPGETATMMSAEVHDKKTLPPNRYNESTLHTAMEGAGRFAATRKRTRRNLPSSSGLGTPATRDDIIDGLIRDNYLYRVGRDLYASPRGMRLIEQLRDMKVDLLTSPQLMAEWERKLKRIEEGKLSRVSFMEKIEDLTCKIVKSVKVYTKTPPKRHWSEFLVPCPCCEPPSLGQDDEFYRCLELGCSFRLSKVIAKRPLSEEEVRTLIVEKLVGPLSGFVKRDPKRRLAGAFFTASLCLEENEHGRLETRFVSKASLKIERIAEAEVETILSGNEVCPCPSCQRGTIYEAPHSYVYDHHVSGKSCRERIMKVICDYEIPRE